MPENGHGEEALARLRTDVEELKSGMSRAAANHKLALSDTASDLRAEMEMMRNELLQTLQAAVVYILDEEEGEEHSEDLENAAAIKLQAVIRGRRARRPHRQASNMSSIDSLFESLPDMPATSRSTNHQGSPLPRENGVVHAPLTAEADRRRSSPFVPVPESDSEVEERAWTPPALSTKPVAPRSLTPVMAIFDMAPPEAPSAAAGVLTIATATDEPIPVQDLLALRRKIDMLLALAGVDEPGTPSEEAAAASPNEDDADDPDAILDAALHATPAPEQSLLQELQRGLDDIVENLTTGWFWSRGRGKE